MNTFVQRLVAEAGNLSSNITKLTEFFSTDTFASLPKHDRDLLELQHGAMKQYYSILLKRLDKLQTPQ